MNKSRAIALATLALLLAGCAPLWVFTHYGPSAPGGKARGPFSGEWSGSPDTIQFVRNEVTIDVKAEEIGDELSICVQLEVPRNREVRLREPVVHVSLPSHPTGFRGTLNKYYPTDPTWRIDQVMKGETREVRGIFGSRSHGKVYRLAARLIIPRSETVEVTPPEMDIDGQPAGLPAILFKKQKSIQFYVPTGC